MHCTSAKRDYLYNAPAGSYRNTIHEKPHERVTAADKDSSIGEKSIEVLLVHHRLEALASSLLLPIAVVKLN